MNQFQPGEQVYVRLVFQNVVPIKNAYIVFMHQEDENEQIVFGFKAEEQPLEPNPKRLIDIAPFIEKDKKPGVYALDKINFETFSGKTLDYQGNVGTPKFKVIPEREVAPVVEDVSIFTRMHWEAIKAREG